MILLYILLALAANVLLIAFICFRMTFYVPKKIIIGPDDYPIPDGEIYEPYREQMVAWMKEVRQLPCRELTATSHDGLTLYGKYYEFSPDAPTEIMFHGYRGSAERDLCGGVQRAFSLGHSVLIVDQRAAGHSGGNVITFGYHESKDCLKWIEKATEEFGPERKLILTGISMGASTVLMAAGNPLPDNVVAVLADCGYTSAKEIIQTVIAQMHLPPTPVYPFVRLGAILFGGFDPNRADATAALANCKVPVIFAHGDADAFVPCDMSRTNYGACPAKKELVIIPGAGHGLCYLADPAGYLSQLKAFFDSVI
ncbi:MAG: alpha/beta hydrolase [Ruminococcaceae bacterium]|nr:alpha/beta hydrolase [Oscillospiraceae bacterium]